MNIDVFSFIYAFNYSTWGFPVLIHFTLGLMSSICFPFPYAIKEPFFFTS